MERIRRSLNFDLNQNMLSEYYGKSNTQAYHEIGKFLQETLDVKFLHRQGSGYVSVENLESTDVYLVVEALQENFPWFNKCTSCIDVTSVGKVYDLTTLDTMSVDAITVSEQGLPNKRRSFNFDLNTDSLKEHFSATSPNNAYKKIESFMESHGFEHRQGSGYLSYRPLSMSQALYLFGQMKKDMPWLMNCVNKLDLTEAERVFDLKPYFEMAERAGEVTKNGYPERNVWVQDSLGSLVSYFDNETGFEGEVFVKHSDFESTSFTAEEVAENGALELLAEAFPSHSFTITSVISDLNVSLAYELADAMTEYGNEVFSQTDFCMDSVPSCYENILSGDLSSQISMLKDCLTENPHRQDDPEFGREGKLTKLIKRLEGAEKKQPSKDRRSGRSYGLSKSKSANERTENKKDIKEKVR